MLTYQKTMASWGRCAVGLDAGGGFGVMFLFVTALFVMPLVGAVTGTMAVVASALLHRTPRFPRLSSRVPLAITIAGAGVMAYLIKIWTAEGVPPEGYCQML
ncbi:hypothetical protein [Nocardia wallacei]|uniref:hypothetical protein n=1 Tax=Nocardia wallacei TaxID=480035 RepID=UPI0024565157|nr:hypothetical protein [Nocardia wallacei]